MAAFGPFERMLALRYLRARRKEGFVSVIAGFSLLGIGLGVATLIIVMAVMNGFRTDLLTRILGLNGHVTIQGSADQMVAFDQLATQVRKVEGVVDAVPTIEGQVLVTAKDNSSGAIVRGLRPDDLKARPVLSDKIVRGRFEDYAAGKGVMIGTRMAQRFALTIGDQITLITPKGRQGPFGSLPTIRSYPIVALFEVGMYEFDNAFVFMTLEQAQSYFRLGEAITHLDVMVQDPDRVGAVMIRFLDSLPRGLRLLDWREKHATFFGALQVERNVMFLILTLIILVAAFNVISGMIMLVKDKARNIAILRTMGATRGSIMRIFFMTGASVGVVGTTVGLILGVAFCENIESVRRGLEWLLDTKLFPAEIYFLATMPAEMQLGETVSVAVMALVLSFLATIYPSWRAARLDPVEALRYE